MHTELFNVIDSTTEEYVGFLHDICSFEATARDKEDIDKMMDYIEAFTRSKGFSVIRTPFEKCGDFLTIDINVGAEKGQVFLAHTDTVHKKGFFGYPCVRIENDRMVGPGTIDCKGGIAIALLAMFALKKCGFEKHTRLILTSDEEISNVLGGEKEQEFFKDAIKGFKSALNCETTRGNEVVVSRKGILRKEIKIKGKGGHSGIDYFNASSAVLEAAHKIVRLEGNSQEGRSSYNCSVIKGGSVPNCIPDECSFIVDIRTRNLEDMDEAERVVREITATSYVSGTTAVATTISSRPPMLRNADTQELFDRLNALSQKYDLGELVPVESGGGSDSAYTQGAGVPSLCGLGGSGDHCHTNKEYITLASIPQRAKLLAAYCREF